MFDLEAQVKRCDLQLRTEYLGIATDIYKICDIEYLIHCKNCYTNFSELTEKFNNSIRTIGTPVSLALEKPSTYKQLVKGIDFENVVSNFEGVAVTWIDIENVLASKFHDIDFRSIYENPQKRGEMVIEISDETNMEQERCLIEFLESIRLAFKEYRIDKVHKDEPVKRKSFEYKYDPIYCFTDNKLDFSKRDSSLWFENAERMFTNDFTKDDLYFYDNNKTKCFINCSMLENINLRNNILLYDTIYCSLPLESEFAGFLEKQNVKKDELLELVNMDRLKFLLTNTENRYDIDFLKEAYKTNSTSVITKRGINSLIACDLAEINKNYIFSDIDMWGDIGVICELLSKEKGIDIKKIFSLLSWPIKARIEAFRTLNFGSPHLVSNFGVNTVIDLGGFPGQEKENVEFEFMVNSHNIHIANALEATYFPFFSRDKSYSDAGVANIVGNLLNFYKYSSTNQLRELDKVRKINREEKNMINLLGVREPVSILKFEEYSRKYDTINGLKRILTNFEKMSQEERRKKIVEYNNLLIEIGEACGKSSINPIDYILSGGGFIPIIGTYSSVLSLLKSLYDDTLKDDRKKILKIIDKLSVKEYSKCEKDDIYMLSKIDRIANLK